MVDRNTKNIILGSTGSVAAIKTLELASYLSDDGYSVAIIPTEKSMHFMKAQAKQDNKNDIIANNAKEYITNSYPHLFSSINKNKVMMVSITLQLCAG